MKTRILSLVIIGLMAGTMLISCGAASKNDVKSAQKNINEANTDLKLARTDAQNEIRTNIKSDWEKFMVESETEIEERNIQIEELRKEVSKVNEERQQKFTDGLDNLEEKKNVLKEKLAKRNREFEATLVQIDESSRIITKEFEKTFVKEMNELLLELNSLFKNNVE